MSNFLNTSDTRLYAISEEELSDWECAVPDPENNEDEIMLLWNPIDKDTPQAEEEDAFLEDISQKLPVNEWGNREIFKQ